MIGFLGHTHWCLGVVIVPFYFSSTRLVNTFCMVGVSINYPNSFNLLCEANLGAILSSALRNSNPVLGPNVLFLNMVVLSFNVKHKNPMFSF